MNTPPSSWLFFLGFFFFVLITGSSSLSCCHNKQKLCYTSKHAGPKKWTKIMSGKAQITNTFMKPCYQLGNHWPFNWPVQQQKRVTNPVIQTKLCTPVISLRKKLSKYLADLQTKQNCIILSTHMWPWKWVKVTKTVTNTQTIMVCCFHRIMVCCFHKGKACQKSAYCFVLFLSYY